MYTATDKQQVLQIPWKCFKLVKSYYLHVAVKYKFAI